MDKCSPMQRVIEVIRATNKPSGVGILLDNSGSTPPLCRFHRFSSAFVKFFFFPVEFQVYVSIHSTTSGWIRKEKEEGNIWEINLRLFRRCAGYFRAISQSETPFSLSFLSIRMFSNGILAFVTILGTHKSGSIRRCCVFFIFDRPAAFSSLLARTANPMCMS